MYAATSATSPAISSFFSRHRRRTFSPITCSSFPRHPRRRVHRYPIRNPFRNPNPNPNPSPSDQRDVNLSLDIQSLSDRASSALTRTLKSSDARLRHFLSSGADAFDDLRTSVVVDLRPGHRYVGFSCRRSSVLFVGKLLFWSVAAVVAVRVLMWVRVGLGFGGEGVVVKRRDRSLGGREVVVGMRRRWEEEEEKKGNWVSMNPLSDAKEIEMRVRKDTGRVGAVRKEERLPEWWPESVAVPAGFVGNEELKRDADRLVRG